MNIEKYEIQIWEAAKNQNADAFLEVVDPNAVMICGGFRCNGTEYAEFIKNFDIAEYTISDFEILFETDNVCQIFYKVNTSVADERNMDLAGKFYVTSTWKKTDGTWKMIYNMDSRTEE